MKTIRKTLLATAFAATVAATLTGASLRGETKEVDMTAICNTAAWPMIPAACIDGAGAQSVRYVTADISESDRDMKDRFAVAFQ